MKPILIFQITAFLLFCTVLFGQEQILSENGNAEAEFHVAINPIDSNNIVVATMKGYQNAEDSHLTIYYTKDCGITWQQSSFQGKYDGHLGAVDPVLAFNNNGDLTLVNLVHNAAFNIYTILSESKDQGATWSLKYVFDDLGFSDKPWITIDNSADSPYYGNIYEPIKEVDVQLLSFNPDYTLIQNEKVVGANHIPSIVSNKAGAVFVSTLNWFSDEPHELWVSKYSDAGATLDHASFVTSFPNVAFDVDNISYRFQPTPYMAIDNSEGPYSGRMYLSYTASKELSPRHFDVMLSHSDDDGLTWSDPKPVHSDTRDSIQQFYSSIYVNDNGVLVIDWYDRTNYAPTDLHTDFYLGISHDGGESFTEFKLTSESMDFGITTEAGFRFGIGDYHQLVATKSQAISFWSDGRTNDGDLNIYFAKVAIDQTSTSVIEQSMITNNISVSNIFPIPAHDMLNFKIDLKEALTLKFDVFSTDGKLLKEGSWIKYKSGIHNINTPISMKNGSYIHRVSSSNGYYKNQKF